MAWQVINRTGKPILHTDLCVVGDTVGSDAGWVLASVPACDWLDMASADLRSVDAVCAGAGVRVAIEDIDNSEGDDSGEGHGEDVDDAADGSGVAMANGVGTKFGLLLPSSLLESGDVEPAMLLLLVVSVTDGTLLAGVSSCEVELEGMLTT